MSEESAARSPGCPSPQPSNGDPPQEVADGAAPDASDSAVTSTVPSPWSNEADVPDESSATNPNPSTSTTYEGEGVGRVFTNVNSFSVVSSSRGTTDTAVPSANRCVTGDGTFVPCAQRAGPEAATNQDDHWRSSVGGAGAWGSGSLTANQGTGQWCSCFSMTNQSIWNHGLPVDNQGVDAWDLDLLMASQRIWNDGLPVANRGIGPLGSGFPLANQGIGLWGSGLSVANRRRWNCNCPLSNHSRDDWAFAVLMADQRLSSYGCPQGTSPWSFGPSTTNQSTWDCRFPLTIYGPGPGTYSVDIPTTYFPGLPDTSQGTRWSDGLSEANRDMSNYIRHGAGRATPPRGYGQFEGNGRSSGVRRSNAVGHSVNIYVVENGNQSGASPRPSATLAGVEPASLEGTGQNTTPLAPWEQPPFLSSSTRTSPALLEVWVFPQPTATVEVTVDCTQQHTRPQVSTRLQPPTRPRPPTRQRLPTRPHAHNHLHSNDRPHAHNHLHFINRPHAHDRPQQPTCPQSQTTTHIITTVHMPTTTYMPTTIYTPIIAHTPPIAHNHQHAHNCPQLPAHPPQPGPPSSGKHA